jgi:outer membrane protein TolC
LTGRPEAAAARAAVDAAAEECRAQRGGWFPRVRALGRYERARPNAQFFPPRDEWDDDAFVGAAATWDALDGGLTRARVREAAARLVQAESRLAETEESVLLEVREACIGLQGALAALLVATRAEPSARRNVAVVGDLWRAGLARHSDVLAAEADLTDLEYGVAAARVDVALARVALAHAAGRLEAPAP